MAQVKRHQRKLGGKIVQVASYTNRKQSKSFISLMLRKYGIADSVRVKPDGDKFLIFLNRKVPNVQGIPINLKLTEIPANQVNQKWRYEQIKEYVAKEHALLANKSITSEVIMNTESILTKYPLLKKSRVKAHSRTSKKTGKVAQVREHTDSRTKKDRAKHPAQDFKFVADQLINAWEHNTEQEMYEHLKKNTNRFDSKKLKNLVKVWYNNDTARNHVILDLKPGDPKFWSFFDKIMGGGDSNNVSMKINGVTFGRNNQGLRSQNDGTLYYYQAPGGAKHAEADFGKFMVKIGNLVTSGEKAKITSKLKKSMLDNFPLLQKARVKAHSRKMQSGKIAQVREHTDTRKEKIPFQLKINQVSFGNAVKEGLMKKLGIKEKEAVEVMRAHNEDIKKEWHDYSHGKYTSDANWKTGFKNTVAGMVAGLYLKEKEFQNDMVNWKRERFDAGKKRDLEVPPSRKEMEYKKRFKNQGRGEDHHKKMKAVVAKIGVGEVARIDNFDYVIKKIGDTTFQAKELGGSLKTFDYKNHAISDVGVHEKLNVKKPAGDRSFRGLNDHVHGKETKVFFDKDALWYATSSGSGQTTYLRGKGYITNKTGDSNEDKTMVGNLKKWAEHAKPIKKDSIRALYKIPHFNSNLQTNGEHSGLEIHGGKAKPVKSSYMLIANEKNTVITFFDTKAEADGFMGSTKKSILDDFPLLAKAISKVKQHQKRSGKTGKVSTVRQHQRSTRGGKPKPKREMSSQAAVGKEVRKLLQEMGVKASVTSESFAGGNAVDIRMENVPPKIRKQIEKLTKKYEYGHFDGMTDMYEYSNSRDDIPQVKYLMIENKYTDDLYVKAWSVVRNFYGGFEELPKDYDKAKREWLKDWSTDVQNFVWRALSGGNVHGKITDKVWAKIGIKNQEVKGFKPEKPKPKVKAKPALAPDDIEGYVKQKQAEADTQKSLSKFPLLHKAHVKTHQRKMKSGKTTQVREHETSVQKKADTPARKKARALDKKRWTPKEGDKVRVKTNAKGTAWETGYIVGIRAEHAKINYGTKDNPIYGNKTPVPLKDLEIAMDEPGTKPDKYENNYLGYENDVKAELQRQFPKVTAKMADDLVSETHEKTIQAEWNKEKATPPSKVAENIMISDAKTKTKENQPMSKERYMEVGKTIHQQIGQRAFYMIGAKNFGVGHNPGENLGYLGFKIMRNSKGVNYVKISLNGKDLYDMEFHYITMKTHKIKSTAKDVYFDQLRPTLETHTGLNTSLGTMGRKSLDAYPLLQKAIQPDMEKSIQFPTSGSRLFEAMQFQIVRCKAELAIIEVANPQVPIYENGGAEVTVAEPLNGEPAKPVEPKIVGFKDSYVVRNKKGQLEWLEIMLRNLDIKKTYELDKYELKSYGL